MYAYYENLMIVCLLYSVIENICCFGRAWTNVICPFPMDDIVDGITSCFSHELSTVFILIEHKLKK